MFAVVLLGFSCKFVLITVIIRQVISRTNLCLYAKVKPRSTYWRKLVILYSIAFSYCFVLQGCAVCLDLLLSQIVQASHITYMTNLEIIVREFFTLPCTSLWSPHTNICTHGMVFWISYGTALWKKNSCNYFRVYPLHGHVNTWLS